ncbi:MAG: SDR family oxidoreductase [Betaproteobacteria bacterium]|nr:SDR family oxidoreductase [Betaproteobacteria bacterium]
MSVRFDYAGQVVLVTGGTKGIGRGIAEGFLGAGATVIVCGRNAPVEAPSAGGRNAEFISCDVREAEAIKTLLAEVMRRHGRLDVLVNNAGGSPSVAAATASPRFHEGIIRLNLIAPLNAAQAANAIMQLQAEGGAIIFIGSIGALRPAPGTAAYSAAKAGIAMLAWGLAQEWSPRVRVTAVSPGLVHTDQADVHYGSMEVSEAVAATIPMRRMATPTDVANACLMLAAPELAYTAGSNLYVHGGGEPPVFQYVVESLLKNATEMGGTLE